MSDLASTGGNTLNKNAAKVPANSNMPPNRNAVVSKADILRIDSNIFRFGENLNDELAEHSKPNQMNSNFRQSSLSLLKTAEQRSVGQGYWAWFTNASTSCILFKGLSSHNSFYFSSVLIFNASAYLFATHPHWSSR